MVKMENVCAGYSGEEILHDINLEFGAGQVTVIVGPNGCGKSTLLKTIVRLQEHSEGTILIDEIPIEKYESAQLAQRVSYLPQNKRTPDIGVFRMVLHGRFAYLNYPRRYREEDYEVAHRALKWVGMENFAHKNVNELSGGNQQNVYIAMILAQDTNTILLDEPTNYLDIAHQLKMMKLARGLADSGKAVVIVLHDLPQAFQTADKIVVIDDGRVKACGNPETVYRSGIVQEVFGVKFERLKVEDEWKYFVCER